MTDLKYFIYCRKSSEDTSKQILSLPAQKRELTEFAKKLNLSVVGIFQESKSAFKTGREQFNQMLKKLEKGEANGVIVWQANRIARNSYDGGRFIYFMDEGYIKELKTPYRTFKSTPDDKFILNLEFGMAKKDSDDKSENVKRGNREKFFKKRIWIGPAKPGYLNHTNPITKETEIITDPVRFPLLQKAFKLLLAGKHTPMEIFNILNNDWGYRTRRTAKTGNKTLSASRFYAVLSDPYYYGLMVRKEGKIMGTHKPMITDTEFDEIQTILGRKDRPCITKHYFPYKMALKCGECGGSITAEEKYQIICPDCKTKFHLGKTTDKCIKCGLLIQDMKPRKMLHYVYYHCTKKKNPNCSQGSVTIKKLEKMIVEALKGFEIPENFRDWAIKRLNELNEKETKAELSVSQNLNKLIEEKEQEIANLLKLKISVANNKGQLISEDDYIKTRKELKDDLKELETKRKKLKQRMDTWHDKAIETFNLACFARRDFKKGSPRVKTDILISLGSNLTLYDKKLVMDDKNPFFLIKKGKQKVVSELAKLEPEKVFDLASIKALPASINPYWLGGRDSNPDTQIQSLRSYH